MHHIILVESCYLVSVVENEDKTIEKCVIYKIEPDDKLTKVHKSNMSAIIYCIVDILCNSNTRSIKYAYLENNCKNNCPISLNVYDTYTYVIFKNGFECKLTFDKDYIKKCNSLAYEIAQFYTSPIYFYKIICYDYDLNYELCIKDYTDCVRYMDIILDDIVPRSEEYSSASKNPESLSNYIYDNLINISFVLPPYNIFCVGKDDENIDTHINYNKNYYKKWNSDKTTEVENLFEKISDEIGEIQQQRDVDINIGHYIYFTRK